MTYSKTVSHLFLFLMLSLPSLDHSLSAPPPPAPRPPLTPPTPPAVYLFSCFSFPFPRIPSFCARPSNSPSRPSLSPTFPNLICLTIASQAPMHVEQAPLRREAVAVSGRRTAGVVRGGEQGPGHGGGVERVQVAESRCRQRKTAQGGGMRVMGELSKVGRRASRWSSPLMRSRSSGRRACAGTWAGARQRGRRRGEWARGFPLFSI